MSFCVGPKMLKFATEPLLISVIEAQVTFVFVFRPKMEFHFRRHFCLRPKMKNAFSVGLYIKLFQIRPRPYTLKDFQTLSTPSTIPVPDSLL